MPKKKLFLESELANLAKELRVKAGRTKTQAAKELGVTRPSIQLAEENPEQSLFALRRRMIETYSAYKVIGPLFLIEKK